MRLSLECHPQSGPGPIDSIVADVQWKGQSEISIRYEIRGEVDQLIWPAIKSSERVDELWQSTCMELFLGSDLDPEYLEYNFSPSTCWALYAFAGYRERQQNPVMASPVKISSVREADSAELIVHASVPSNWAGGQLPKLKLGLSAILESINGEKSFWALAHPPGKPDFHHSACFNYQFKAAENL